MAAKQKPAPQKQAKKSPGAQAQRARPDNAKPISFLPAGARGFKKVAGGPHMFAIEGGSPDRRVPGSPKVPGISIGKSRGDIHLEFTS